MLVDAINTSGSKSGLSAKIFRGAASAALRGAKLLGVANL